MTTLTLPVIPEVSKDPFGLDVTSSATVPVGPSLSMFDPLFVGIDEFGQPVYLDILFHNMLVAGEPGGGKSGLINNVGAYGALCDNTRLVLFDGKLVELGPWMDVADEFVGPDIDHAISVLQRLGPCRRSEAQREHEPNDQSLVASLRNHVATSWL